MRDKSKSLFKNMGILALSNFASKILTFFLVPLYTSVLSTDEYGCYDLVYTSINLLFPILTANIADGVMRFMMNETYNHKKVLIIGLRYSVLSCVLFGIMLILNSMFGIIGFAKDNAILIFLYFACFVFQQLMINYAKGSNRVLDMGIASVIGTIITIGANVLFLLILEMGLKGFFYAYILGCAIPTLYYFVRFRVWKYSIFTDVDANLKKSMIAYSVPLILTTLSWTINNSLDKYAASFFCGVAATGLLSVAYKIPNILSVLQGIFTQAWQISAVAEYGSKDSVDYYDSVFAFVSAFGTICCSLLIVFNRLIAHLLFANAFYQAWMYVPFLLVSVNLNSMSGFLGPILSAEMNSKGMAKSAVLGSVSNTVLNILLIWTIGLQGATIATAISSLIIYVSRKRFIKRNLSKNVCQVAYVSWFILALQAVAECYFMNYWASISLFILTCIVNRRCLINMVSMLFSFKKNFKDQK